MQIEEEILTLYCETCGAVLDPDLCQTDGEFIKQEMADFIIEHQDHQKHGVVWVYSEDDEWIVDDTLTPLRLLALH